MLRHPAYGVTIHGTDDAGFSVNLKTPWTIIFGSTQASAPNNKDVVIQIRPTSRHWRSRFTGQRELKTLKIGELFAYTTSTQFSRGA